MRKKRNLILAITLCGLLLAGGSLAYMAAAMAPLTNPFTFGTTEIDIDEDFDGWDLKEVCLVNVAGEGRVPGVVRALLIPVLKDADSGRTIGGDMGPLSDPTGGTELVLGDLTFELDPDWETNWFYKDGYFYYRTVLQPGETTAPLLHRVRLTDDTPAMREKYADITITVEVFADILQAAGGAASQAWGITVTGTTVGP